MRKTATLLLATTLSVSVAACGSSSTTSSGTTATTTTAASSAGSTGSSTGSSTAGSSNTGKKVSANTATEAELITALTAAGVSNPGRWANEIDEYRPYDKSDASLMKLKSELAKYSPGTDTLNKIISVLEP